MKIFKQFNTSGNCFICNTNENKPCVLIPKDNTEDDGIEEAEQVHIDCINLRYNPEINFFYQKVSNKWKTKFKSLNQPLKKLLIKL